MTRTIRYAPLLSLTLRHGYYTGGAARSLSLTPTGTTQNLLAGNLCRARMTPGHYAVWYGDQNGTAPARDLPGYTILSFTLHSNDPQFSVITQPDWGDADLIGQCLYFSDKGATGTAPLTLPSADAVVLPVRPRGFQRPADAGAERLTLLRWFDDVTVWTEPATSPPPRHINLAGVAQDGRYLLKSGDKTVLDFYLSALPAAQMLGALEIGWIEHAFDTPGVIPRDLTLQFAARRGIWTYFITTTARDVPLENAVIEGADGTTPFGAGIKTTIRGRDGAAFRSLAPLPLAERYGPEARLELKLPQVGMRIPTPVSLPMAGPDGLQKAAQNDGFDFAVYVML